MGGTSSMYSASYSGTDVPSFTPLYQSMTPASAREMAAREADARRALRRFMVLEYGDVCLCGLTFELSGRQRQDAEPGLVKMYRVPPARAWWPAVGAPLERGVRAHLAGAKHPTAQQPVQCEWRGRRQHIAHPRSTSGDRALVGRGRPDERIQAPGL